MKKLIFISTLILMAGTIYGQTLQKGNYLRINVLTVDLNQNVTMGKFLDIFENKVIPAHEKNFQSKCYLTNSVRGQCENCYGVIMVWKSEEDWNKFWKKEGGLTDIGQAAMDKFEPQIDELEKLGTVDLKYTDWIIQ